METVAVLGTGRMGGAIARRLKESGFELTLWNRAKEKAERLNVGAVASTPVEAIRSADIVISSLTGPAAVRRVYFGPDGVFTNSAGKLLIEMSTAGPDVVEQLAQEAQAEGSRLLEAPVLGSVPAVESGTLAVLVGGATQDLEQARPVLARLGEVHYVGDLRSAARLKLVANSMLAISSAAAAELLAAGTAAGLDRDQLFWVLARFVPALKMRECGFLRKHYEPPLFAIRDLIKDLDLALEVYRRADADVPLTLETRSLFEDITPQSDNLDISAIVKRYTTEQRPGPDPAHDSTSN
jgi:3-hydroxyisobutyrate dehydrogenase-like beta-hydroxyacid dehydrogenase